MFVSLLILKHENMKTKTKQLFTTVIVLFFFATTSLLVAQETTNSKVGVFEFETETIDYGTINKGDDGNRTFTFVNKGNAPIIITKIKSSCGCTVPTYSKEPILPGEKGEIKVKYATTRVGAFSKTITVLSNAEKPQKPLRIKGKVLDKTSI